MPRKSILPLGGNVVNRGLSAINKETDSPRMLNGIVGVGGACANRQTSFGCYLQRN